MSSVKRKNVILRRSMKELPCTVCGKTPSDPCHIRTWKATQSDNPKNLIPMCRVHHQEQHAKGWATFLFKYPQVFELLKGRGWEFDPKIGGGLHLIHPEVK